MGAADEQLMLAYGEGDAAAFETLYRRHKDALYRFMLRNVRERALADELFQDVWMRVIEARGRYQPQARFSTWLYTIAHNRMVDHWRKRGLTLVSLEAEAEGDKGPPEPAADSGSDPRQQLEGKQGLERFRRALEALPPAQREAFLLHQEAEMSIAEIASATGSSEEAAKSRLRYALSKLKEAMSDDA
jgi:RNA polymerase sigma factor (sigma-70 family)